MILAGTGDPIGYDRPSFKLRGAGALVVRDLTFRSPGTGRGGIGFITGENNVNTLRAYSSVLGENLRSLRAMPSMTASG